MSSNLKKYMFQSLHSAKRKKVLAAHRRYLPFVIKHGGTLAEFQALIYHFILSQLSSSYCRAVIITLVSHLRRQNSSYKRPFHDSLITRTYKRAQKIKDSIDNNQPLYTTDQDELRFNGLGEITINHGTNTHIDMTEADQLEQMARHILGAYLSDRAASYTPEVEVAMLIVLLANTGMRNGEARQLKRLHVFDQLSTNNKFQAHTKTGLRDIYVGPALVHLLREFVSHPTKIQGESIFIFKYPKLRQIAKRFYRQLFKKTMPKGALFHVWRSIFSSRGAQICPLLTQQTLNHGSGMITNGYVKNQLLNDKQMKLNFLSELERKNPAAIATAAALKPDTI